MKVTVITGNQPRHIALINRISKVCENVYALIESTTLFPGEIEDFYHASPPMEKYMGQVRRAEANLFPNSHFVNSNVKSLVCKFGDLNKFTQKDIAQALSSDMYIVFGSSFIKGWLCDFLVENRALNLHMGLSPFYRGSSCNFWALYDKLPNFVGATWHLLSKGLDSGPIIFHSAPIHAGEDAFHFTMKAVLAAQEDLVNVFQNLANRSFICEPQEKKLELRYSRYADFTDEVAIEFMARDNSPRAISKMIEASDRPTLSALH